MLHFAQTAEAIAATAKKTAKVSRLALYFKARSIDEAAVAALFFSGRIFPARSETTLQVGGSMLWQALRDASGATDIALTAAYRRHGDLGAAAYDVLIKPQLERAGPSPEGVSLLDAAEFFRRVAETRRPAMKASIVTELLERASALEAKYLVKLMAGELRIGLRESLVEEAIARAFDAEVKQVQRANMLLGDIAATLRLAADHRLGDARMRLFHPLGFMLASPAQTAEEAFGEFQHAVVEDKYDGIRAQAHCGRDAAGKARVRIFSRTLDDITESFPELAPGLGAFSDDVILDGEIVAWASNETDEETQQAASLRNAHERGRALPFSRLQQRLGRKRVTAADMRDVPVAYVCFDVLYAGEELVIDRPLRERVEILDGVFVEARQVEQIETSDPQAQFVFEPAVPHLPTEDRCGPPEGKGGRPGRHSPIQSHVLRAPAVRADSAQQLEELFELAQARGNEGLMIKNVESPYTPGRRGKWWLKLKRELATLDVVVTAVEWGHGKRANVLSDYTFAVRDGDRLRNVGKAYSGLTDVEIARMTEWFLAHTVEDRGFTRTVEPEIVIEVAFNAVMESDRHDSGYALRFPRILRLRPDKLVSEIDTITRVREVFERQHLPRSA